MKTEAVSFLFDKMDRRFRNSKYRIHVITDVATGECPVEFQNLQDFCLHHDVNLISGYVRHVNHQGEEKMIGPIYIDTDRIVSITGEEA